MGQYTVTLANGIFVTFIVIGYAFPHTFSIFNDVEVFGRGYYALNNNRYFFLNFHLVLPPRFLEQAEQAFLAFMM
jgi:hypothetical protein